VAEEVQIGNVGGDGVASEVTLQRLVQATEAMAKKSGIDSKGAAAKLQKLYNQEVKSSVDAVKEQTDATEEQTDATKDVTQETNKLAASLGGAVAKGIGSLWQSTLGLAGALTSGQEDLADFTQHIPLIGGHLSTLVGLVDENLSSFRELSKVGAQFGDGLNDIRAISARAGIPLGEFTDLIANNSGRMKLFGATTAQGAAEFAKLSKELRTGPGRAFIAMGYTAQELNESLIEYAEFSQSQIGKDRNNNRLTAQGAADYLGTINELAAVTGKRRDQIKEELNAGLADQRQRLAIASMSKEEGERFAANMSQAPASLKEALTDMADGIANTPIAQGMMAASETFRTQAANIKNMNAMEYNNFMATVGQELDQAGQNLGAGADAVMASGSAYGLAISAAAELRDKGLMTEQQFQDMKNAANAQQLRDEGITGFSNAVRDIRTGLMDAFVTSGALDMITDALNTVAEYIGTPEFKEALISGVTSLISGIKKVWGFFSGIGDWFGTGAITVAIVAGLGAMFAGKAIVGALTKGVGGLVSSMTSGITSRLGLGGGAPAAAGAAPARGGRPGRAGAGIGAGIGNIGAGIGKGLGGVLKGLASGIAAFANPAVLLGGTNIALVIVGIGAAVAGATWMIGAALPTMAEGMKSFEELNGSKLVDAGLGMLSVAAGLAAIGAGGVAGAVGGAASGLIDGISGFFGAESPLDKMLAFQEYDFDAVRIENNAKAMASYSKGMALMGGAGVVSGIGGAIGAFGGAIAGLFGEDSPLDKISLFQAYTFDPIKIANNASAVEAYSKGMAALGSAEAVGGVGSILGAIGGWFSGNDDMPWESVKAFGNADINLEGVTANAAAVNAMSSSLNSFSVEKLDTTGIVSYTSAMERLVEVLGELNDALSADNQAGFGTGTNAGDVVSKMDTIGSGGGAGSDQLNNTMQRVEQVLTEIRDFDEEIKKNTSNIAGSNLALGNLS
jgi:transcription termination factor NusB